MRLVKSVVKLTLICSFLALPMAINSYAEETVKASEGTSSEIDMASSFEEALAQNQELNERYQAANPEEQKQIQENWQARKTKWDSMTDEEKAALKTKIQERQAKWNSMTDEEKAAAKAKMQESKAKWNSMTDEQKAALKTKIQERRANSGK